MAFDYPGLVGVCGAIDINGASALKFEICSDRYRLYIYCPFPGCRGGHQGQASIMDRISGNWNQRFLGNGQLTPAWLVTGRAVHPAWRRRGE